MNRAFLKTLYEGTWMRDCVDYLDDEFFNPQKEVRYWYCRNFWKLEPIEDVKLSLVEQIKVEREYRDKRMRLSPKGESEKIYFEVTLDMSRDREQRLVRKMDRRNNAVGDLDKARSYPIEEIITFAHGFARCLWHNDSAPSLHWHKKHNVAYCFSCARGYDSISAAQKVWGLTFLEAVKKLTT